MCLNAIPRTMLESRGGESIKGAVIADAEMVALGRLVVEALGVRGPATIQVFRDPEVGLGITDVNTRFGGAFPAPVYAALPGRTYPELIVAMAAGRHDRAPRRRVQQRDDLHALLLAAGAGRVDAPRRAATSCRAARPLRAEDARRAPANRAIGPECGLDSLFVATQLADSRSEQGRPETEGGAETPPSPSPSPPQSEPGLGCASCGARMAPGQDWCLQCGAGAPGSVGGRGWRPLATVLVATVALVLVAAAAGYAALSKKTRTAAVVTTTVAQAPPAPAATTPGATTPTTPAPPPGAVAKPPKIPLTAATPLPAATTPAVTPAPTPAPTGSGNQNNSGTGGSKPAEEPHPEALVLDTNAASTYNPYNYPAAWFGDPSLTIDGDTTTGWTRTGQPRDGPEPRRGPADRSQVGPEALGREARHEHARD